MQDVRSSDCRGSSEEGGDSEEDTGEETYVDEFNNDDDESDSEGDVEKRGTASLRMLLLVGLFRRILVHEIPSSYKLYLALSLLPPFSSNLNVSF